MSATRMVAPPLYFCPSLKALHCWREAENIYRLMPNGGGGGRRASDEITREGGGGEIALPKIPKAENPYREGEGGSIFSHHPCPISFRFATLAVTGTAAMGRGAQGGDSWKRVGGREGKTYWGSRAQREDASPEGLLEKQNPHFFRHPEPTFGCRFSSSSSSSSSPPLPPPPFFASRKLASCPPSPSPRLASRSFPARFFGAAPGEGIGFALGAPWRRRRGGGGEEEFVRSWLGQQRRSPGVFVSLELGNGLESRREGGRPGSSFASTSSPQPWRRRRLPPWLTPAPCRPRTHGARAYESRP